MPVNIPKSHEGPLRELILMGAETRKRLIGAISSSHAVIDLRELISKLQRDSQLDEKTVSRIVRMLISMSRASEGHSEFVGQVTESAKELIGEKNLDWSEFSDDLAKMLRTDGALGLTAKVEGLRGEYSKVFCGARVISDIRPVFGSDPMAIPVAAAVVHTLRVTYHEDDEHREFYVALDSVDLREVRDAVERAMKKERSLRTTIEKGGIRFLDAEVRDAAGN